MILILSRESAESTTESVIDWLKKSGFSYYRFNGSDLHNGKVKIHFYLDEEVNQWKFLLKDKEVLIESKDVKAVWFRRSFDSSTRNLIDYTSQSVSEYKSIDRINRYHYNEGWNFLKLFEKCLRDVFWLNKPSDLTDKLEILEIALKNGFRVPKTFICNNKVYLEQQLLLEKRLITKASTEATTFEVEGEAISGLTIQIGKSNLKDSSSEMFFPSLFQKSIDKKYEVRVFYLDGEIFSAAIFSQKNDNTISDYRNYDYKKPNRVEPIKLPEEIENSIHKVMVAVNINCGSIDLIKSYDNEYYFLEINPVGQFMGISEDGNFQLDRKISELLIKKAYERKQIID